MICGLSLTTQKHYRMVFLERLLGRHNLKRLFQESRWEILSFVFVSKVLYGIIFFCHVASCFFKASGLPISLRTVVFGSQFGDFCLLPFCFQLNSRLK